MAAWLRCALPASPSFLLPSTIQFAANTGIPSIPSRLLGWGVLGATGVAEGCEGEGEERGSTLWRRALQVYNVSCCAPVESRLADESDRFHSVQSSARLCSGGSESRPHYTRSLSATICNAWTRQEHNEESERDRRPSSSHSFITEENNCRQFPKKHCKFSFLYVVVNLRQKKKYSSNIKQDCRD